MLADGLLTVVQTCHQFISEDRGKDRVSPINVASILISIKMHFAAYWWVRRGNTSLISYILRNLDHTFQIMQFGQVAVIDSVPIKDLFY